MRKPNDLVLWSHDALGLEGWSANAASGSHSSLGLERAPSGAALRFDFELVGHGAWAIARRETALALPAHYVVTLRIRGDAPPIELQVKLVDSSANVWWWRRRDLVLSRESERLVLHRASLTFAWGPASGGDPHHLGAIEIAIASDHGARGTIRIEDLRLEPREPMIGPPRPCVVRASSNVADHEPACVLDGRASSSWRPQASDPLPWIELDLGRVCEWGGLVADFAGSGVAPSTRILASDDGVSWTTLVEEPAGVCGRRWLKTGEAESRFARIELPAGNGAGITRLAVVPIELAVSPARWAATRAKAARRGRFPRHLLGEQAYWAVVGGDGDERKGLLGEDGALEIDAEAFTVEPFLQADGHLITWADVDRSASLVDGCLPIPSVEWTGAAGLRLAETAFASGEPGASMLVARYEIENRSDAPRTVTLLLAIRPFQVTPAWQSLNIVGGVAPITRLERAGARIRVNHTREVVAVTDPDRFGAVTCEQGLGTVLNEPFPTAERADDPLGFAAGVLAFDLLLGPSGKETIVIAVPLFEGTPPPPAGLDRARAAAWGAARLADAVAAWRTRLARVPISLPPCAAPFEASLRASLAWILVNREGPRIQPGPRCYRRSWIRDGTLSGTALAEMGFAEEARAFLRWYAPYQFEDGRVPCAVGRQGVDRAVEHDSHGQLVWGVVEVFRLTGDRAFLRELWPRVLRAVDAIASLREERLHERFRDRCCFGLLPESISHEGYAASPVHAYWDDFFAVCALADAAEAAGVLGDVGQAERIRALRDAMRRDLHTSIACTITRHAINVLPGSAELGDFDPTSSAIALDPCGEGSRLPPAALARTFERYWEEFEARRRGTAVADAYTPYEIRNAVALLHLGQKDRALALLEWLIDDQRPVAWRQWPEVAHRDRRAPRFLGDLPHGWVASSFVRSVRRLLAYERDEDGVLVIAAGVPEAWVREPPGIRVRGLATHFGPIDFTLCAEGDDRVRVTIRLQARPPGGIIVESPLARPLREVVIDGQTRGVEDPARVHLRDVPAEILLSY